MCGRTGNRTDVARKAVPYSAPLAIHGASMSSTKQPAKDGNQSDRSGWAETMKAALAKKRPPGGWPAQAKPRDSGIQKVKKNAF